MLLDSHYWYSNMRNNFKKKHLYNQMLCCPSMLFAMIRCKVTYPVSTFRQNSILPWNNSLWQSSQKRRAHNRRIAHLLFMHEKLLLFEVLSLDRSLLVPCHSAFAACDPAAEERSTLLPELGAQAAVDQDVDGWVHNWNVEDGYIRHFLRSYWH